MEGREKGKFRMEAANMQKCTLGPMYNVHVQVHYMYLCMYVYYLTTCTCTCLPCINFKDPACPAELPWWPSW